MSDRLFALEVGSPQSEPVLVTMAAIAVYDRGASADHGVRYEAELAGYAVVRAAGASPWEAVRALLAHSSGLARPALVVGRAMGVTAKPVLGAEALAWRLAFKWGAGRAAAGGQSGTAHVTCHNGSQCDAILLSRAMGDASPRV